MLGSLVGVGMLGLVGILGIVMIGFKIVFKIVEVFDFNIVIVE